MYVTKIRFFHENVGSSAWGLGIHQASRLIAVGSNLREVTVFSHASREYQVGIDEASDVGKADMTGYLEDIGSGFLSDETFQTIENIHESGIDSTCA